MQHDDLWRGRINNGPFTPVPLLGADWSRLSHKWVNIFPHIKRIPRERMQSAHQSLFNTPFWWGGLHCCWLRVPRSSCWEKLKLSCSRGSTGPYAEQAWAAEECQCDPTATGGKPHYLTPQTTVRQGACPFTASSLHPSGARVKVMPQSTKIRTQLFAGHIRASAQAWDSYTLHKDISLRMLGSRQTDVFYSAKKILRTLSIKTRKSSKWMSGNTLKALGVNLNPSHT